MKYSFALLSLLLALSISARAEDFKVPIVYYKLPNGLKVVLSQDTTVPTVAVEICFNIGFRVEPRGRTGFAHLFEHMMFQGSPHLPKGEFPKLIESVGGSFNGTTRFDYTNYYETFPAGNLELVLWAESDRLSGVDLSPQNLQNQQEVVSNEVKLNVIEPPYGGFPWLDMPQYANQNFFNAHNFYGSLQDIQASTRPELQQFFQSYYAPNNAVLVVVGNFQIPQTRAWIEKYFAAIPAVPNPAQPDLSEPRQIQEKQATRSDRLAPRPGLALAYHMPERNTPEYFAMGLLNQILLEGDDALLCQELVRNRKYTSAVDGGINCTLGNMFDYKGPMLMMASLIHEPGVSPAEILAAADQIILPLTNRPVDQATLKRAMIKMRSSLYRLLEPGDPIELANLLACFALFDDDPSAINRLEGRFRAVTPALIQKTAQEFLRPGNRTILVLKPEGTHE